MQTNNIQISKKMAQVLNGLFGTTQWDSYKSVLEKAYETARSNLEDANRDEKLYQGIARAYSEICNIENKVKKILEIAD